MITREAPQALVNSVLAWCPEVENRGAIIAGGFIRAYFAGEHPSDMDLYFQEQPHFDAFTALMKQRGWAEEASTERAITLLKDGKAVQLIRYVFGRPSDIIQQFDFTVCAASMIVFNPTNAPKGNLVLHDDFFEHLAGRVLIFQGSSLPLASLKRVIKYVKRGYSICDENLIAMVEAIARTVNFDDQQSIADHIAGMDPNGERRIRVID